MWLRRYSLRMFDSEVCFYYRNHPSVVQLAGQTYKNTAHPFAFNRKSSISTLNHSQGPKDNFCMRQTREWWWITTRFSCWSVIIIMYATVIKWLHIWNCSWPRFTWPAFGHGNPEIGFFIYLYRMICIGIVSVDENSSLEHSLSPSRSKFSSTGGDLGDELTPLHQAIGFHGNSRVISIFMAKFLSILLSPNVKRFLGHSLSPLRSKISSNESEFRDRPHPLHFMKFSFGFTAILVYFRFFWLKSRWRRIRGWKEVSETYLISLGVKVSIIWQQFYWQATQALHRVLVWFHGHSGVFSNFSDRIRDVIVSEREKMFPGHSLSSLRSKFSSNASNSHLKPTTFLMESLIGFHVKPHIFSVSMASVVLIFF